MVGLRRPLFVLFGSSIVQLSFSNGGWGAILADVYAHKAFSVIATSPLQIDLSCVLEHVVGELTAFLRKANRALRQATLGTLNSVIVAYGDKIGSTAYEVIIAELSTLISDSDLHMTALALELCCTLMAERRSIPNVGLTVRNKVLPQALTLVRSSLLQGQALLALQSFFAALVYSANTSFDALLDSLLSSAKPTPQSGGVAKQALFSIAQCVAVLCLAAGDQKCSSTVKMLTDILKDDGSTNSSPADVESGVNTSYGSTNPSAGPTSAY